MRSCSRAPRSRFGAACQLATRVRLLTATPSIAIGGGADVICQGLEAGVVDELAVIVAPVILGGGKALARRCPTRGSHRRAAEVGRPDRVAGEAAG
jgi:riboflavin biosynthesis pyrimidine reductase